MTERRTFAQLQAEYRRAILLRFLSEDADYAMDTGLLKSALKSVGHGVPLRQVNEDAAWLEERGLAACEPLESALLVRITRRGLDVACGDEIVPGVKRPGPGV